MSWQIMQAPLYRLHGEGDRTCNEAEPTNEGTANNAGGIRDHTSPAN